MGVNFEELQIGHEYERPFLADHWGYKGFQAISRGVITPAGTKFIVLFVTKEKQESLAQYNDSLNGEVLHWEGEEKHSSDSRIINASKTNDRIYLFYREKHHSPFVFCGQVFLRSFTKHKERPSQFTFAVGQRDLAPDPIDDIEAHQSEFTALTKTEKEAIIKSRIGQGAFRESLIKLWGGCSVTGLPNSSLLRASHVKPWRVCSNHERLDPTNGLLLHPVLDHLFDAGLISFHEVGRVILSRKLSESEIALLHINRDWKLRANVVGLNKYLGYHREKVFKQG